MSSNTKRPVLSYERYGRFILTVTAHPSLPPMATNDDAADLLERGLFTTAIYTTTSLRPLLFTQAVGCAIDMPDALLIKFPAIEGTLAAARECRMLTGNRLEQIRAGGGRMRRVIAETPEKFSESEIVDVERALEQIAALEALWEALSNKPWDCLELDSQ